RFRSLRVRLGRSVVCQPLLINSRAMAEEETLQESELAAPEDGDAAALQGAGIPVSDDADVEVEREEDAPPVAELDPETKARRDAALRHVRKLGDPVLRASALPVERFDEQLAEEIERM